MKHMEVSSAAPASGNAAFTRIDLAAILCTLAVLAVALLPALARTRVEPQGMQCLSNLRQIGVLFQIYADEHQDIFPPHRNTLYPAGDTTKDEYDWWGSTITGHIGDTNYSPKLFHCPALGEHNLTWGVSWSWAFNVDFVGYGYNSWFLGYHPNVASTAIIIAGHTFVNTESFKRAQVKHPADCLLIGDEDPTVSHGTAQWSSSLWWPNAWMDPSGNSPNEGIATTRHFGEGNVMFVDGHGEGRPDQAINPQGPTSQPVKFLKNSQYWDPLQR